MHNFHISQVKSLRTNSHNKKNTSHLCQIICDTGVNYTSLNLYDSLPQQNENIKMMQEKIVMWKSVILHGRHTYDFETAGVGETASRACLKAGELSQKQLDL